MYRVSKYHNKKIEIDGIKFDSKKEGRRYKELKLLERSGLIFNLVLQVPFNLIESFKYQGSTIRWIKYIADFTYLKDGQQYVEDVNGFKTDVYKLKKKMLLEKYGNDIYFIET